MSYLLDIKLVRENPDLVKQMLHNRNISFPVDELLQLDKKRRSLIAETQELKHEKNVVSEEIAGAKRKGQSGEATISRMRTLSDRIAHADQEIKATEHEIRRLLLALPNIPHESVPVGPDASYNIVTKQWGTQPRFSFQPTDHIDLGSKLGLIDVERAARVAGARFYFLKGDLVQLNYALARYGLDFLAARGFELLQPPYMLKRDAIGGAVILSDFEDVIYKIADEDLYLIGTSEHAMAAMHMDEVFEGSRLPIRYAGISPCFRKEAGAHGRDTKGIFRVHQFEKVEQFVFAEPEASWEEHERLLANAEEFYQSLELPYRVVVLSTGDMGKVAAKTYDLEVWLPGQEKYREVVSCSNCTDFQARSLNVKYREKPHEEARLVHTLNSTLVATERTIIAILENFQQADGTVAIPRKLQSYMSGKTLIGRSEHTA